MASPAPSQKPLLGSAPVACSACRRLKMRCQGAEKPPCARCVRTGRRCVVTPSRRGQTQANSLRKRLPPASSSTSEVQTATPAFTTTSAKSPWLAPPEPPRTASHRSPTQRLDAHSSPASISRTENISSPSLPSVYSSSPLDVLGSVATQEPLVASQLQHQPEPRDNWTGNSGHVEVSENVLVEYIEL